MRDRIGVRVAGLHGFTREEYQTGINGVLERTAFKGSYRMELTDTWMQFALQQGQ